MKMQSAPTKKARMKKFNTILSDELCEYYRNCTFQYGVLPFYRPLHCKNVTLAY